MARRLLIGLVAAVALTAAAASPNPDAQRLADAEAVLTTAVGSDGIPKDLLEDASCIGVFPGASKERFRAGGEFARGVFTCRRADGTMGAPAFFSLSTGIATWSFPADSADVVVLVMSPEGRQHLMAARTSFGPSATTVAGPVGRDLSTSVQLHASMLSWVHVGEVTTGTTLDGNVLSQDMRATETFYGSRVAAKDILLDPTMATPKAAESFVRVTSDYANPAS